MKPTLKPGYVSSSRNNGILRHGCHTTHSLTVSTQVINLTPPTPKKMLVSLALLSSTVPTCSRVQLCTNLQNPFFRACKERVSGVVNSNLHDGICGTK